MTHHQLFTQFPIDGQFQLGDETVSTPYHIYDGSILFIGGRANAAVATELLQQNQLTPLIDENGQALVGLWICDFTQANLGAHHELQLSIFASFQPQPRLKAHPFAIYRQLTLNPETMMVCHGLWNNTERVVRYNQAHLQLNARPCQSHFVIDQAAGHWRFQFDDAADAQALVSGKVILPKPSTAVLWQMSRQLGLRGLLKTMRAPFVEVPVVNTVSAYAQKNHIARTYTHSHSQQIGFFDEHTQLTIHAPAYAALQFQPDFVQYNRGVHFVYLRPTAVA